MTQHPDASRLAPPDVMFGKNLAAHFHLKESQQLSTRWAKDSVFGITRLKSGKGTPDCTPHVPSEAALDIGVSLSSCIFDLWIDGKAVGLPPISALATSVMDLESDPVCWVKTGFDYVHYHVPKAGLDEIAKDHGFGPISAYKLVVPERDIVMTELTRQILPLIGSRDWKGSLALDQFSLIFGAHVLRTYGGLSAMEAPKQGGLAPWQRRRATEMIRERLHGDIRLSDMAREVGLSVSHFTRAFRKSFGLSPYRWLVERRIERAKALLLSSGLPIADIAVRSGFSDQTSFTRAFTRIAGDSPGQWRRAMDNSGEA
jgi:AraC family transcriptional regulator